MTDPLNISAQVQEFQHPLDTLTRPRTLYEDFIYNKDMVLGIDFEDKLVIYTTLLLFTWICNTGIVVQMQFKKEVGTWKLILYSVFIPVALFMILIPILMYFEIWANYRALVFAVIISNFFVYYLTRSTVRKKERIVRFSEKINDLKEDLSNMIDGGNPKEENKEKLKELKEELEEFGPKYYNGL